MDGKKHIFRETDSDLGHIDRRVGMVWDLVEAQWQVAQSALRGSEAGHPVDTASREDSINELVREIERGTTRFLALRQPLADDLRFIVAALRIAIDLERIGDYAANIVQRAAQAGVDRVAAQVDSVPRMADMVLTMLRALHEDYTDRSPRQCAEAVAPAGELNTLYERVFEALRAHMTQNPASIETCTELLVIAGNIERSSDHAKNIAHHLSTLFTGLSCEPAQPAIKKGTAGT